MHSLVKHISPGYDLMLLIWTYILVPSESLIVFIHTGPYHTLFFYHVQLLKVFCLLFVPPWYTGYLNCKLLLLPTMWCNPFKTGSHDKKNLSVSVPINCERDRNRFMTLIGLCTNWQFFLLLSQPNPQHLELLMCSLQMTCCQLWNLSVVNILENKHCLAHIFILQSTFLFCECLLSSLKNTSRGVFRTVS